MNGQCDDPDPDRRAAIEQVRRLDIADSDISSHWGSTGLCGLPDVQKAERRGFFQRLFGTEGPDDHTGHVTEAARRGANIVSVHLPSDEKAAEVEHILTLASAIDLDERIEVWRASDYAGYEPASSALSVQALTRERERLAAFTKEVRLGKRALPAAGTRVLRHGGEATARPEGSDRSTTALPGDDQRFASAAQTTAARPASDERADGNALTLPRVPDAAALRAFDAGGYTLEFIATREEALISNRAHVVEEILVDTEIVETTHTVRDTVRRAEVDIERFGPDALGAARDPAVPPAPADRHCSRPTGGRPVGRSSRHAWCMRSAYRISR